jgi:hypothetical protein
MDHAILAMVAISLAAVQPNGLRIVDANGVSRQSRLALVRSRHEAREVTTVEILAGAVECGLCDCVVLSHG